jgi:hypothetical protein
VKGRRSASLHASLPVSRCAATLRLSLARLLTTGVLRGRPAPDCLGPRGAAASPCFLGRGLATCRLAGERLPSGRLLGPSRRSTPRGGSGGDGALLVGATGGLFGRGPTRRCALSWPTCVQPSQCSCRWSCSDGPAACAPTRSSARLSAHPFVVVLLREKCLVSLQASGSPPRRSCRGSLFLPKAARVEPLPMPVGLKRCRQYASDAGWQQFLCLPRTVASTPCPGFDSKPKRQLLAGEGRQHPAWDRSAPANWHATSGMGAAYGRALARRTGARQGQGAPG